MELLKVLVGLGLALVGLYLVATTENRRRDWKYDGGRAELDGEGRWVHKKDSAPSFIPILIGFILALIGASLAAFTVGSWS